MLIDKRLRLGFKQNLLARDLAQSAMCFYDSTNNDLIEARFFYLILRVKSWGVGWEGNGGGGGGACVNGWRLF